MAKAYIFPGQGSQSVGMGKDLYQTSARARELFELANDVLGFRITDLMFDGTDDDLRQTKVTQPAVFLHSVTAALSLEDYKPDMVAGHSLGEFSALVASGALGFEDGLRLVSARAEAMQRCCDANKGGMAAVIGMSDDAVRTICAELRSKGSIIVAANFNTPGQVVISGTADAIADACVEFKSRGAKRALPLPVGGAFHSPLMEAAGIELSEAISMASFKTPVCPIYQNVDALPHTDPEEIKSNILLQLTSPVLWSDSVKNMLRDGAEEFVECGPGTALTKMVERIQMS